VQTAADPSPGRRLEDDAAQQARIARYFSSHRSGSRPALTS
jgi:hypothetical protein